LVGANCLRNLLKNNAVKRNFVILFSLFLFCGLACKKDPKTHTSSTTESTTKNDALPMPESEFLSRRDTMTEVGYNYLLENFKLEKKIPLKYYSDCKTCICAWEAHFSNHTLYQYTDCNENGFEVNISFNHAGKNELYQLVNNLFSDPNNSWNSDSTLYQSLDGAAGCYYRIISSQGVNSLLYFCGT
jgi:hypothetical protein